MGSSSIHPAKLERTRRVTLSGVPESVRLLLVGSNEAVRRGLELLLSGEAGVEIVGRAESANSAIQMGRELALSTVLIDLESLGERGLEEAAEVRGQLRATVIVLSLRDDQQSRHRADEAGLRFVSKQAGSAGLLALLREGPGD
jgi:DNA-binding NarL/FixJ family response regulator